MWLFLFTFTTIIVSLFTFPKQAQGIIAEFKRQLRLWVIKNTGERTAHSVAREFYQDAVSNGYDLEVVEAVLQERWELISDRLGTHFANELLGEPSPLERYG